MKTDHRAIEYHPDHALVPARRAPEDIHTPLAKLQTEHLLDPAELGRMHAKLDRIRDQISQERRLQPDEVPTELRPLDAGFIDLPRRVFEEKRARGMESELGQIQAAAERLRRDSDRVVILGIGGSYMGARALFEALRDSYHNELNRDERGGIPRIYFDGNNLDNDAFAALRRLLARDANSAGAAGRSSLIVVSKSGGTLETAAAFRILRRDLQRSYAQTPDRFRQLVVAVTGAEGKLRRLADADDYRDTFTIPDDVGGRYSIFTPVGLLPAAVMGLRVEDLLAGAAEMTDRFFTTPADRNPVLQYAAVGYLFAQRGKPIRVLSVWSKKLEAVGLWYDQLLAESLGKDGQGPTPVTAVNTRDLHSRGQQHQEGTRDKLITNLIVCEPREPAVLIGPSDRPEDGLDPMQDRTLPALLDAACAGTNAAYLEAARPTTDIVLPRLDERFLGQLLQMLMLATVVEGRLMGVNPYGQPGVEAYKRHMNAILETTAPAMSPPKPSAP